MPYRFCLDCGKPYDRDKVPGSRCITCQRKQYRQRDQQRGNATQRGYDSQHRKIRQQLLASFEPGQPCAHCGKPLWSKRNLDLAHTADRTGWRGLAHAECNRGNR